MPEPWGDMSHPDDEVTASYLDGSLSSAVRDRFETHLSACDGCRAGLALLAASASSEAASEAEAVPPEFIGRARQAGKSPWAAPAGRAAGAQGRRVGLVAAAAVLAAFVVLAALMQSLSPRADKAGDGPVYRGEERSPFGEIRPAAGSLVPADDLIFYWSPVQGADRYIVSVMDARGQTLAAIEAPGAEGSVAWPEALEPPAGGQFTWRIKAFALDRLVAESKPTPFEVR